MTEKERILCVFKRERPDRIPFMLDISHWFYHRYKIPWDISTRKTEVENDLIEYHKRNGIGFYIANNLAATSVRFRSGVDVKVYKGKTDGIPDITWQYETPVGSVKRTRIWEERSYSWAIKEWGIKTRKDLEVLRYVFEGLSYDIDRGVYTGWTDAVGEQGVVYIPVGYSGMGQLLNYWMGIEGTVFAALDWPDEVKQTVDTVNNGILSNLERILELPGEIIIMGDNFSSDIQHPSFFRQWSADFYREAARMIHESGKYLAVHIDGKLKGALDMIKQTGADCADAVTPKPMGDLTPAQARQEAGNDFIISGGISPDLFLPSAAIEDFKKAVSDWIELKHISPMLIAAAGDQVPPGASEERITLMRQMITEYGRY